MDVKDACVEAYRRLKNLKLAGAELGIPSFSPRAA